MSKGGAQQFHCVQEAEAYRLLGMFVSSPKDFMSEIRFSVGRVILKAINGMDIASSQDPHILIAEETLAQMRLHPYEYAVCQKASGTEKPSFVASLLEQDIPIDIDQDEWADIISWTAGSMYGARGETVHATIVNFVLAMMEHPEVQKKAHDEIDSVARNYFRSVRSANHPPKGVLVQAHLYSGKALMKEVLCWKVALLLGIVHRTTENDDFRGFNIPEGSIVLANAWAIARDPENYDNLLNFVPEHFLSPRALDPENHVFGFGRRVCLGIHFAKNEVWIFIACLLWGLNFSIHIRFSVHCLLTVTLSHDKPNQFSSTYTRVGTNTDSPDPDN
ncbi:hypothetical protein PILCRDRAFT_15933 [Piloderma croceum F 1598]|uniref:Cytochrome P450 n=1 Tax=Piloderma croceum (strain F 1598) TaxID=765440 RepID=A0A0C3EY60_PILCF|nr:hypothetical protein PILCRDRAFT_15933 [Piloderma croceum F 1598]